MRKKMWRCKFCDYRQEFRDTVCQNCGQDLTMGMGEIYFEGQDEQKNTQQQTKSQKGFLLVILALALAAALAVAGVMIWMNRDMDDTSDPVSAGRYTRPSTQPSAEPDTKPTVETTVPPTTLPKNNAVALAPDFGTFAGGYVELDTVDSNDYGSWRIYMLESVEAKEASEQIVQEYMELLSAYYPYKQIAEYANNHNGLVYCFDYTGDAVTSDFVINYNNEKQTCESDIIIWIEQYSLEEYLLYVTYANEIQLEDHGARTTYKPNGATVTEVTLECYDMLLDRDTGERVDWVPEGYEMEYDVIVSYTGTKTKPFTAKVTSSDESVLKVYEDDFFIEAVAPGTATITVTCGGCSDSVEITVCPVDRSDGAYMEIEIGDTTTDADGRNLVAITEIIHFGGEVSTANILWIAQEGIEQVDSTSWEKQEAHVYSRVVTFSYDESVEGDFNILMLFYLVKAGDYGNKDPLSDIMDFYVLD